jgi:hypothetical protein
MIKGLTVLFLMILWSDFVRAQLNLLTPREAISIAEKIPAVKAARKEGCCPLFSYTYSGSEKLDFQVRCGCGPRGDMLVNNYTVNRRTGETTSWGDFPKPVLDSEGEAFAKQIVAQAQKRILSLDEARCLAMEAAKALPGWNGADATVSVKQFNKVNTLEQQAYFIATLVSPSGPLELGRMLTVFLTEARVRDDETGMDLVSAGVSNLASKLIELRSPAWLSDQDVASIAIVIPRIATNLRDGCKVNAGGLPSYSHETTAGVSCKDVPIRESSILINLQTGMVTDPDTGKSLNTAESEKIARQGLDEKNAHRIKLQKEVNDSCMAQ